MTSRFDTMKYIIIIMLSTIVAVAPIIMASSIGEKLPSLKGLAHSSSNIQVKRHLLKCPDCMMQEEYSDGKKQRI